MPDWLKKLWNSFLDIWLPSKWPRLVATTTVGLVITLLTLPKWGPLIGITPTADQISIIRKLGPPWLLFIALGLIHYLVIREKNSSAKLMPWKFHDKVVMGVGAYYDIPTKDGEQFIRITLKDISQKNMPPPYETVNSVPKEIKTEVATIGFTPGFFIYHGFRVKKVNTNSFSNESVFSMCKGDYQEESDSVFFFKTQHMTNGEYFFRCFVEHINPVKNEVELNIFFIWFNHL